MQPLTQRVKKAEQQVDATQQQLQAIEQRLADTGLYEPERKAELTDLLNQQAELNRQASQWEEEWMDASEAKEALEQQLKGD